MSNLFYPKSVYFLIGFIGSLLPLLGEFTANAFTIATELPAAEPIDFLIAKDGGKNRSLSQFMPNTIKVHIPQPENVWPPQFGENGREIELINAPDTEKNRFDRVMQYAIDAQLTDRPLGEIIQAISEQFLGTPYMAGLLDKSNQETLVVTLQEFDCVLFVETVLAIARGISVQDYSYHNFRDRIEQQRYRNGQLNGYCSRLHYFSDWIDDNQNRRIVENLTNYMGGIPLNTTLNFMTQNRQYYPQLANDSEYQCLLNQEAQLANLNIRYIPQDQIATIYHYLQPGDIIATATDIPGLDVTHTGLVYRFPDGGVGLIHASPSGEVKISRDLQSYVQRVDGQIGIIVARPYQ